jgi:hypothetical protein
MVWHQPDGLIAGMNHPIRFIACMGPGPMVLVRDSVHLGYAQKYRRKGMKKLLSILVLVGIMVCAGHVNAAPLYPSQDTQIAQLMGDANFGTYTDLTTNWNPETANKGLLQFDLSGLTGPVAHMYLNVYHEDNSVLGATFALYQVTSSWDATAVTWNSRPSAETTPFSSLTINDNNQNVWRSFDVTTMVNAWLSGTTNYGMLLARVDQDNPVAYFKSSESSTVPYLDVNPAAVPLPSAILLFGPGLVGIAAIRRRFKK